MDVYDATDPDWALVGRDGEYGFAPANYIEKLEGHDADPPPESLDSVLATFVAAPVKHVAFSAPPREDSPPPPTPPRPVSVESRDYELPATNLTSVMQHRPAQSSMSSNRSPMASPTLPPRESHQERHQERSLKPAPSYTRSESEDSDGPEIPVRRPGQPRYTGANNHGEDIFAIPPGFQTYPVQEVDSKKKRAATLGVGPTRIILLPDKSTRPREEWSVENLKGYNSEGKHVFIELKKPDRSLDLHAGSKDAAEGIISALADIRNAYKQPGLDEVVAAAAGGSKKDIGTILYDFQAKGDDEVSVIVGDEVIIIDATSEEWWLVERRVNGERGVVPASYIDRGRSTVVGGGIMASPADPRDRVKSQHSSGGGRGTGIPTRTSSLAGNHQRPEGRRVRPDSATSSDKAPATSGKQSMLQSSRSRYRKSGTWGAILLTAAITEPDSSQVRQWTDRTGNFKVEAQFIGYKDGKINLHKLNGVKIAVPVGKMALEDLEYVEKRAGISLDEVKPVSAFTQKYRKSQQPQAGVSFGASSGKPVSAQAVSPSATTSTRPKNGGFDWFDFFLSCGVDVNNCQRYATAFERDSMDEAVLEDIQPEVMRMLGLKEGDILRVKKKLDEKYGRTKKSGVHFDEDREEGSGSLFSGPGGTLKNNTRKGRPAPAVQTPGSVDPDAFKQNARSGSPRISHVPASKSPSPTQGTERAAGGFDDDAWAPKPTSKIQSPAPQQPPRVVSPAAAATAPPPVTAPPQQPAPIGALGDLLSLSTPSLQPTITAPTQPALVQPTPQIQQTPVMQSPQPFLPQQPTGINYGVGNIPSPPPMPQFASQPNMMNNFTGMGQSQNQYTLGRQRPMAPGITGANGSGLTIPPPPQRPGSAPQNFTGMSMPPLTQTFTGQPMMSNYGQMGTQPMQFPNMGMQAPMAMQPTGQMFPMNTGMMQQNTGLPYMNLVGQPPVGGIQQPMPQNTMQPPIISQPTGMLQNFGQQPSFMSQQSTMDTGRGMGINSFLPSPLVPTATGSQQQMLGVKPLIAQPTGPPPNVKFGVNSAARLVPQPTGRADLSKASMFPFFLPYSIGLLIDVISTAADNPFGF